MKKKRANGHNSIAKHAPTHTNVQNILLHLAGKQSVRSVQKTTDRKMAGSKMTGVIIASIVVFFTKNNKKIK